MIGIILFVFFAIIITVIIVAAKIKIDRRKQKEQYYKDIHKIAENPDKNKKKD